tara:strand:+ start:16 stop:201 length:186 start_codon:yes stop_codon:yes gene_type:complete
VAVAVLEQGKREKMEMMVTQQLVDLKETLLMGIYLLMEYQELMEMVEQVEVGMLEVAVQDG